MTRTPARMVACNTATATTKHAQPSLATTTVDHSSLYTNRHAKQALIDLGSTQHDGIIHFSLPITVFPDHWRRFLDLAASLFFSLYDMTTLETK